LRARLAIAIATLAGCTESLPVVATGSFRVRVTQIDGKDPPTFDAPLPANSGDRLEQWEFAAEALDARGALDTAFAGYARMSVVPGSGYEVQGAIEGGRNVKFTAGRAAGSAGVTSMFGVTRLWLTDVGYEPAPIGVVPACSNGVDDDGDVLVDFPNDPGCAFANDMSETEGSLRTGVSQPIYYARPTIADVQGRGTATPYAAVAVDIEAKEPHVLVVTRVASDGFYVTDLADLATGWASIFAFNFNTPHGMRICDRLTVLSGTASEFFGFTELSFPSWELDPYFEGESCPVPEPAVLAPETVLDPVKMEANESGLVRLEGYKVASHLGQKTPIDCAKSPADCARPGLRWGFALDRSNCDVNGDGVLDFYGDAEGSCVQQCDEDPECSEWNEFVSVRAFKMYRPLGAPAGQRACFATDACIRVTTVAAGFDPRGYDRDPALSLIAVTGTLRNFSGGSLNWTVEARCVDDVVCDFDQKACVPKVVPSSLACAKGRTEIDNDAGTN
jgi:hypothetical protein